MTKTLPCGFCGTCGRCRLIRAYPEKYAPVFGIDPATVDRLPNDRKPVAVKTSPPCTLLGEPLTDEEKADRDLYQLREYRWCLHPARPLGEAVCSCSGCGTGCSGYKPSPDCVSGSDA